jgi:hypothetical protein
MDFESHRRRTRIILSVKHRRGASFAFIVLILSAFLFPLFLLAPVVKAAALYDSGDPTPAEQLVLEYINRARSNPIAEGSRLGIDIHEGLTDPSLVGPRPPLAMNKILLGIASAHSQNMYNQNYFSHNDPNGATPYDRMTNAGYNYWRAGEDMAAGTYLSATDLEDLMMVDAGTPGRAHRVNLLDLINAYPCGYPPCVYSEVGIGNYQGAAPNAIGLGSLITEDFGAPAGAGAFLLGVVYNDANHNNFYDIGEGIAGVTITTSSGGYYTVSSSSGGYALPIGNSGTVTVTASGPGFGPISQTVVFNGVNVKVDFTSQMSSTTSVTQTSSSSSHSTTQTVFQPITFQSTPSSFFGTMAPATITACGSTFANSQSASNCGSSFTAYANLPSPSTGWQFDHWVWAGGVTCSSSSANPVSCSASVAGGSLMAVYRAQITLATNPSSSALIGWGSCSNPGNGVSFFSTSYGSASATACYVPSAFTLSSWSCSGGLACSGSSNPTTVTFSGPGTLTMNLQAQTHTTSTTSTTSSTASSSATIFIVRPLSSSTTMSTGSSSTSNLMVTTLTTYSSPEFGSGQAVMIGVIIVFLSILANRKVSRRQSPERA